MDRIITLDEFIIRRQNDFEYATGELTGLLRDIGVSDIHRILFQGYYLKFDVEMRRYIDHCSDMNYSLRYIGSMVSRL